GVGAGGPLPRIAGDTALKPPAALLLLLLCAAAPVRAASSTLDAFLSSVARDVASEFADKGLKEDGLSISLVELSSPGQPAGSFRGDAAYYPASVVKMFFLAYYESQKEKGRLRDTPELVRAVRDMITVSSND